MHDIILFYTKSSDYKFNQQFDQYEEDYIKQRYRFKDLDGRLWAPSDLMAAGIRHGESGKPWHGIDPTSTGNHWKYTIAKLDDMYSSGKIYVTRDGAGKPTYKRYLDEMSGVLLQDIWDKKVFQLTQHRKNALDFKHKNQSHFWRE